MVCEFLHGCNNKFDSATRHNLPKWSKSSVASVHSGGKVWQNLVMAGRRGLKKVSLLSSGISLANTWRRLKMSLTTPTASGSGYCWVTCAARWIVNCWSGIRQEEHQAGRERQLWGCLQHYLTSYCYIIIWILLHVVHLWCFLTNNFGGISQLIELRTLQLYPKNSCFTHCVLGEACNRYFPWAITDM